MGVNKQQMAQAQANQMMGDANQYYGYNQPQTPTPAPAPVAPHVPSASDPSLYGMNDPRMTMSGAALAKQPPPPTMMPVNQPQINTMQAPPVAPQPQIQQLLAGLQRMMQPVQQQPLGQIAGAMGQQMGQMGMNSQMGGVQQAQQAQQDALRAQQQMGMQAPASTTPGTVGPGMPDFSRGLLSNDPYGFNTPGPGKVWSPYVGSRGGWVAAPTGGQGQPGASPTGQVPPMGGMQPTGQVPPQQPYGGGPQGGQMYGQNPQMLQIMNMLRPFLMPGSGGKAGKGGGGMGTGGGGVGGGTPLIGITGPAYYGGGGVMAQPGTRAY